VLGQPSCEQQDLEVAPCICFPNCKHEYNWLLCNKNILTKSNLCNNVNRESRLLEWVTGIGHDMYILTTYKTKVLNVKQNFVWYTIPLLKFTCKNELCMNIKSSGRKSLP
jgi:hypothetical protein